MNLLRLAFASSLVLGCGVPPSPTSAPSIPPLAASLNTPDGSVGVFIDRLGTHLWLGQDTGSQGGTKPPTVHLFSLDGETGRTYNTFVFGLAPQGAVKVDLDGLEYVGGIVANGAYVIASEAKDVIPSQIVWTFHDAEGNVIAQGSNITP